MSWHIDVLEPAQRKALGLMASAAHAEGFVLHGGTALALRLGHRLSNDFDWFCATPLRDPAALAQKLKSNGVPFDIMRVAGGTLYGSVLGVKVSFMEYVFPDMAEAEKSPEGTFSTASLDDIATEKLMAIATRGSRKDLVDIFFLIEKYKPLAEFVRLYKKRYSIEDPGPIFLGLNYFEDAERAVMPKMLLPVKWPQVKKALQKWVREASQIEKKG